MNKLLIYLEDGLPFEINSVKAAIMSVAGVCHIQDRLHIGSIYECDYVHADSATLIRLGPKADIITAEGLCDNSLRFAFELQDKVSSPLWITDMGFNFNFRLRNRRSLSEMKSAIGQSYYEE